MGALPRFEQLPAWLRADLRSDHAGELGAVYIYRGILAVTTDVALRDFADRHLRQEREHLHFFEAWLSPAQRSALLPLWRFSGFILGALSALFGPAAVYTTIDAVERFVVAHYARQIARLQMTGDGVAIAEVLQNFCADEQRHRNDAVQRHPVQKRARLAGAWAAIVALGSRIAVCTARWV